MISETFLEIIFIIFIAFIYYYLKNTLPSYLKEKSKNLATKQDIQEITNKVESVKNEYKEHFSKFDRYNSKQFEIYNNLWVSLVELKFSADDLWDKANQKNLKDFSAKVSLAKKSIESSSLLLEHDDYVNLISLIKSFNEFQFGKGLLLEKIKNKTTLDFRNSLVDDTEISSTIENNRLIKEEYDNLIIKLKQKFTIQIKGEK